jgi:peptidoglycan/LPS O-acetylase OafA/YrhL
MAQVDHRNVALQALRGVAACSVMLFHGAHFTAVRTGAAWLEKAFPGQLAVYGVLVFFVLSGYLMEAAVRRYDAGTFLLHRCARLYPSYWLICAAFFLVQSWRAGAWEPVPWLSLNLLPLGEMRRPLGVEWTLLYEVFFYGVCAALCLWRQVYAAVLLLWLGIIVVAVVEFDRYGSVMQPTITQIPFSVWNVGFICGGAAGWLNRRLRDVDPTWLALGGVTLVLLGNLATSFPDLFVVCPGMACIVLSIVRSPPRASPGPLLRALFVLGECSYGLYLAHSLAIQIALQYVPAFRNEQPLTVFAGVIGVGLAAGLVAGRIDIELYRRLKQRIDAYTARRAGSRIAASSAAATPLPQRADG